MTDRLTDDELAELARLESEAFCAPWTYTTWEIDCPNIGSGDECGYDHNTTVVLAPDEYPAEPRSPQVVAQIDVPGIDMLADRNGKLIAAARNALPRLIAEVRELRVALDAALTQAGLDAEERERVRGGT